MAVEPGFFLCFHTFFLSTGKFNVTELVLFHIMCGYQCDKAVDKNDTREVIYDIISLVN